uniref:Uncharacterized protein n=1 Tax=Arundo donax TaxID=35708 RepID=A0A0A9B702_ARUDO
MREQMPLHRSSQTASSQTVAGPRGSPPPTTTARTINTSTTEGFLCTASEEGTMSTDAASAVVFQPEKTSTR